MPESDPLLAPQDVTVSFMVDEVTGTLQSLKLLNDINTLSGLGEWVVQTSAALPPEVARRNHLVLDVFDMIPFHVLLPEHTTTFLQYVERIEQQDAAFLRDGLLNAWRQIPTRHPEMAERLPVIPSADELRHSREAFMRLASACWAEGGFANLPYPTIYEDCYDYIQDAPALKALVVSHLRFMWHEHFAAEWTRVLPVLRESVSAFQKVQYPPMSAVDAIRAVTGRDVRGIWDNKLANADHLTFVPSTHIGPYLAVFPLGADLRVNFGARLPRGVQIGSSAVTRSELLTRLNALADDTRLRILELLTQHDELCAQDIIEMLDLSQSSISRHLSQLTASGYLTQRRREVAKCYSLNPDRVVDTLRALTNFLSRQ